MKSGSMALASITAFALGICSTIAVTRLTSEHSVKAQSVMGYMPTVPLLKAAVPIVAPLPTIMQSNNLYLGVGPGPSRYVLDGMVASNNLYSNPAGVTFTYGGGAFRMEHSTFLGPLNLEFEGAAANTFTLLDSLGLILHTPKTIPNPAALPTKLEMNKPRKQKVTLSHPLKGDISSQYDGSQPPQ